MIPCSVLSHEHSVSVHWPGSCCGFLTVMVLYQSSQTPPCTIQKGPVLPPITKGCLIVSAKWRLLNWSPHPKKCPLQFTCHTVHQWCVYNANLSCHIRTEHPLKAPDYKKTYIHMECKIFLDMTLAYLHCLISQNISAPTILSSLFSYNSPQTLEGTSTLLLTCSYLQNPLPFHIYPANSYSTIKTQLKHPLLWKDSTKMIVSNPCAILKIPSWEALALHGT